MRRCERSTECRVTEGYAGAPDAVALLLSRRRQVGAPRAPHPDPGRSGAAPSPPGRSPPPRTRIHAEVRPRTPRAPRAPRGGRHPPRTPAARPAGPRPHRRPAPPAGADGAAATTVARPSRIVLLSCQGFMGHLPELVPGGAWSIGAADCTCGYRR
jgi:hypothetical protein